MLNRFWPLLLSLCFGFAAEAKGVTLMIDPQASERVKYGASRLEV